MYLKIASAPPLRGVAEASSSFILRPLSRPPTGLFTTQSTYHNDIVHKKIPTPVNIKNGKQKTNIITPNMLKFALNTVQKHPQMNADVEPLYPNHAKRYI
jgi:hypothetical protein